jgi:hypothetical protein
MSDGTEYSCLSLIADLASFELQVSTVFLMYLVWSSVVSGIKYQLLIFDHTVKIGSFDTKKSKCCGAGLRWNKMIN